MAASAASNMEMSTDEYSGGEIVDGERDESRSVSHEESRKRKIGKTCRTCGEEAAIALKKCKTCGDDFPKKEKDWASIRKLKKPNPTVQRDLLERRADILNHHNDYDIVIMYKRKHLNGVSISTYGTLGLGEAFVSGEGEIGYTFKHMFEAFCQQYGKKSDNASEVIAPPPTDNHVDHPAQPSVNAIPDSQQNVEEGSTSPENGSGLPNYETLVGSHGPTVVFYKENGKNVAVGLLCPDRRTLHGKPVPQGFLVVQVTWVEEIEGGVAAPIRLGDEEENCKLSPGQFFALPTSQLTKTVWRL